MKYNNLIIEKKEYVLLKGYLNLSGFYQDQTLRKSVKKLVGELESAQILDESDMPQDVIRFNTTVTIASKDGWHRTFQLVVPTQSDVKEDRISILTPMGTAVMGYAEGDSVLWEFPSGEQELNVEKVVQGKAPVTINMVL